MQEMHRRSDRRDPDEYKGKPKEYPRGRKNVDRWLKTEQSIPNGRSSQEDGPKDVQIEIFLPILP
jgi:hypothetical protein